MRKIPVPALRFADSMASSISGISKTDLLALFNGQSVPHSLHEQNYVAAAEQLQLHSWPKLMAPKGTDPIVLGTLRKSHFGKLYGQYFRGKSKPARKHYDKILEAADDICPFCSGFGDASTLDHYLPFSGFPLYAVLPANLIPACKDCQGEKLAGFATAQNDLTLNPYFDDDKYFSEQWLHARVLPGTVPTIEFYVQTPQGWSQLETDRVTAHFKSYDLARRYGIHTAGGLSEVIALRRGPFATSTPIEFSASLRSVSANADLPINGFRRVLYAGLAADVWFCNQPF